MVKAGGKDRLHVSEGFHFWPRFQDQETEPSLEVEYR
jgi:hypothetical protein